MAEDAHGLVSHFDALLGTEWLDDDPEHARVRVAMRDQLRQPVGLLHGGVMSSLVESACTSPRRPTCVNWLCSTTK